MLIDSNSYNQNSLNSTLNGNQKFEISEEVLSKIGNLSIDKNLNQQVVIFGKKVIAVDGTNLEKLIDKFGDKIKKDKSFFIAKDSAKEFLEGVYELAVKEIKPKIKKNIIDDKKLLDLTKNIDNRNFADIKELLSEISNGNSKQESLFLVSLSEFANEAIKSDLNFDKNQAIAIRDIDSAIEREKLISKEDSKHKANPIDTENILNQLYKQLQRVQKSIKSTYSKLEKAQNDEVIPLAKNLNNSTSELGFIEKRLKEVLKS